jgi:dTDP-4-amino-4,6-dideoxygalactose transaminase
MSLRAPAFATPRHVGAPNLPDAKALTDRLELALERRWLSNGGPFVAEFERAVERRLGVRHCVTTCNATTGLMLVARALGLTGEVVMPSFTFVGTAHAMRWLGLTPRFCDVDPTTHTLDPDRAAAAVGPRTSAILGVHVWGQPCAVDGLSAVAAEHGLALFFDAAPAFDCALRGTRIGGFGRAEVVSFHATKVLNTFEGGAVLTNDDALAERLRLMVGFGFADDDRVVELGINAKLSEAAAAMGLAQLERFDDVLAVNREHREHYERRLAELPGVTTYAYGEGVEATHHHVVIEVAPEAAPLGRDALQRVLVAENVLARRYFFPGCHRMAPYHREQVGAAAELPVTAALVERVLQLPTGTAVSTGDVETICDLIADAFARPPV